MAKLVYLIRTRFVTYTSGTPFTEEKIEKYTQQLKETKTSWRDPVVSVTLSKVRAAKMLKSSREDCTISLSDNEKVAKEKGVSTTYSLTIYDYYIEMRLAQ